MKAKGIIYAIVDTESKPVYVGSTTNLKNRFKQHRYVTNHELHPGNARPLYQWMLSNKYEVEVLYEEKFKTRDDMVKKEKEYITELNKDHNLFNIISEDTRDLVTKAFILSKETVNKIQSMYYQRKQLKTCSYTYEDLFSEFADFLEADKVNYYNMDKLKEELKKKLDVM